MLPILAIGACGSDGAGGLNEPDDYLANPSIAEAIEFSGLVIHQGSDPPGIEGRYATSGSVVTASDASIVGASFESEVCLYDQTASGNIAMWEFQDGTTSRATGSITGDDAGFTLWEEVAYEFAECREQNAIILSGVPRSDGDLDVQSLFVIMHATACKGVQAGDWALSEGLLDLEGACAGLP